MIWIGPQPVIALAAAALHAAADSQPQTDGSGSPLPPERHVKQTWDVPRQCPCCGLWSLTAPPEAYEVELPEGAEALTPEAFASEHGPEDESPTL